MHRILIQQADITTLAVDAIFNAAAAGGTGTGKTHRARTLGVTAIHQGERVHLYTAVSNAHQPRSAASPEHLHPDWKR